MRKYAKQQRQIVNLCRKYQDVKVEFDTMDGKPVARLYIEPDWDRDDFVPYKEVPSWLSKHAKRKQSQESKNKERILKLMKERENLRSILKELYNRFQEVTDEAGIINEAFGDYIELKRKEAAILALRQETVAHLRKNCCAVLGKSCLNDKITKEINPEATLPF